MRGKNQQTNIKQQEPPSHEAAELNRLIGSQLRVWREATGKDLGNAADAIHVSRSLLGHIESGERRATRDNIILLADCYGRTQSDRYWVLRLAGEDISFDFDSDPKAMEELRKNPPSVQIQNDVLEMIREENPSYDPKPAIGPLAPSEPLQDIYPIKQIDWAFNAMLESPHLPEHLRADIQSATPSIFVQAAFVEVFCRKTATRLLTPMERKRMLHLLFGTTLKQVSKAAQLTWDEFHHFAYFLGTGIDIGNKRADVSEHRGLGLLLRLNNSKLDVWQPKGDVEPFGFHVPREVRDDYEYEDDEDRPWLWNTEPPAPSAPEKEAVRQDMRGCDSTASSKAKRKRPAVSTETTGLE